MSIAEYLHHPIGGISPASEDKIPVSLERDCLRGTANESSAPVYFGKRNIGSDSVHDRASPDMSGEPVRREDLYND